MDKCWCPRGLPVEFVDEITSRGYCKICATSEITSSANAHLQFLAGLLEVVPLDLGERVECRTYGENYDGIGEIIEISEEIKRGGTPVHPAYLVRLDDHRELWYTSICLTRTREKASK